MIIVPPPPIPIIPLPHGAEVARDGRVWTETGRFNPEPRQIVPVAADDPDYVPPAMPLDWMLVYMQCHARDPLARLSIREEARRLREGSNSHTNQEGKQVAQPVKESACVVSLPSSHSSSPWWRRAWDRLSSRITRPVH